MAGNRHASRVWKEIADYRSMIRIEFPGEFDFYDHKRALLDWILQHAAHDAIVEGAVLSIARFALKEMGNYVGKTIREKFRASHT